MDVRSPQSYRITAILIAASVALCALLMVWTEDSDAEVINGGTVGELYWEFDSDSELTITGAGEMDFSGCSGVAPWGPYMDIISTIIIGYGVTSIASEAFSGCDSLTSITIPDSVETIEEDAFGDMVFYDEGGNLLEIDAYYLSGSTFIGSDNTMVKDAPGDDTDTGSPEGAGSSKIVVLIVGILSVALIAYVAVRY